MLEETARGEKVPHVDTNTVLRVASGGEPARVFLGHCHPSAAGLAAIAREVVARLLTPTGSDGVMASEPGSLRR
jgi:hypothetical protein